MTVTEKSSIPEGIQDVKYSPVQNTENDEISEKKSDSLFLYFSVLTATLVCFSGGAAVTWISPVLPKLQSNDSSINPLAEPATTIQISILTGLPPLTGLIGSLLSPYMADLLGRKKCIQVLGLGMLVCDVIVAFSNRMIYIILARSVLFCFFSSSYAVLPLYITEMCEKHNRGKFGCLFALSIPLGNLYTFLLGPFFSVRNFTLITAVPVIPFLILFYFTYETPVHLSSKGKKEECLKSLRHLRNNKSDKELRADLLEIENSLKSRETLNKTTYFSLLKTRQTRISYYLAQVLVVLYLASGAPIILIFLGPIFNKADIMVSGNNSAIIVGTAKVLGFSSAFFIVDKLGRKPLLFISSAGCGLSLLVVGLFFYLKQINSPVVESTQLLPLIGIIIYVILYSIGIGPLPFTIAGELFSPEYRSLALSLLMTLMNIVAALLTAGFPLLDKYAGMQWCMWLFSFNCFFGFIFVYLFLPETGGKSIMEIQEIIKNYKFPLKRH